MNQAVLERSTADPLNGNEQLVIGDIPEIPDGITEYSVDDIVQAVCTQFKCTPQQAMQGIRKAGNFRQIPEGQTDWAIAQITKVTFGKTTSEYSELIVHYALPLPNGGYPRQKSSHLFTKPFPEKFYHAVQDLYPELDRMMIAIISIEKLSDRQATITNIEFKRMADNRLGLKIKFNAHKIDDPGGKKIPFQTPWNYSKPESEDAANPEWIYSPEVDRAVRTIIAMCRESLADRGEA